MKGLNAVKKMTRLNSCEIFSILAIIILICSVVVVLVAGLTTWSYYLLFVCVGVSAVAIISLCNDERL